MLSVFQETFYFFLCIVHVNNNIHFLEKFVYSQSHNLCNYLMNLIKHFEVNRAILQISKIKFIYSEKATHFCEISTLDLSTVVTVKSTVKIISQNLVAFSEYMNFTTCILGLAPSRVFVSLFKSCMDIIYMQQMQIVIT